MRTCCPCLSLSPPSNFSARSGRPISAPGTLPTESWNTAPPAWRVEEEGATTLVHDAVRSLASSARKLPRELSPCRQGRRRTITQGAAPPQEACASREEEEVLQLVVVRERGRTCVGDRVIVWAEAAWWSGAHPKTPRAQSRGRIEGVLCRNGSPRLPGPQVFFWIGGAELGRGDILPRARMVQLEKAETSKHLTTRRRLAGKASFSHATT